MAEEDVEDEKRQAEVPRERPGKLYPSLTRSSTVRMKARAITEQATAMTHARSTDSRSCKVSTLAPQFSRRPSPASYFEVGVSRGLIPLPTRYSADPSLLVVFVASRAHTRSQVVMLVLCAGRVWSGKGKWRWALWRRK